MEIEMNTTGTVTRRRKGWIGRVRTRAGRDHEYWQASLRVDGKPTRKTSKDRSVVEAWLRDRLREHPTYTYPTPLSGGLRPRRGTVRSFVTKSGGTRWRVSVTVDGRRREARFGDRAEAERWLAGILRDHPLCWWGPHPSSASSSVEVDRSSVEVEVGTSPSEGASC